MSFETSASEELLAFFKALSDANRLKIVGLLSNQTYTVEQLASILKLAESTVSHHLSRLLEAGLVEAKALGYYSVFSLKFNTLEDMARRLLSREALSLLTTDMDLEAYDRKVLKDYLLQDGKLKEIPAQRKKLEVILKFIAQDFPEKTRIPEREVNEILARHHDDTATLRREMVGYKILSREKGEYWKK